MQEECGAGCDAKERCIKVMRVTREKAGNSVSYVKKNKKKVGR